MSPLTVEWIDKAEGDYFSSGREWRARNHQNYDSACFYAQKMAQKYLKGFLQEHGVPFKKNHNLMVLLNLCLSVDPIIDLQRPTLLLLDRYSVRFRYPGDWADKDEARQAYRAARDFRLFMRIKLGLP